MSAEDPAPCSAYRPFHGHPISPPAEATLQPAREFLDWHNQRCFRG